MTTARFVVLALGRRGTPRTLGVPGEEQPKVMYQLADAGSYEGQKILVVGGGDSAVEAAIGLARQRGNRVSLSYRREKLVRIKKKNEERVSGLLASGRIEGLFGTEVEEIGAELGPPPHRGRHAGAAQRLRLRLRRRPAPVRPAATGGRAVRRRREGRAPPGPSPPARPDRG